MAARIGALEAGGTKMVLAVGTADGHIEEQVSMPTVEPENVVPDMAKWFADKKVDAIGIGAFGPTVVNPHNPDYGKICFTPKPGWSYYDFLGNMKAGCDVPMGYDTDVNVACLGEATFGCAKGLDSVCYFTVGTGIGAGVMVGGQLLHGMLHPEAGHIMLHKRDNDPGECVCPFHEGCFEGLAAGPSIEKRWGAKGVELAERMEVWELESDYIAEALTDYIMEDLSRWYLHLVRDRSWDEESTDAKTAAYFTLHRAIMSVAVAMAPICPHITDKVYSAMGGDKLTVHMEDWQKGDSSLIDEDIEHSMSLIQKINAVVANEREKMGSKKRWPLKAVYIRGSEAGINDAVKRFNDILAQQVNIKEIAYLEPGKNAPVDVEPVDFGEGDLFVDPTVTPEIEAEGWGRDLIRAIQQMRKNMKLNVEEFIFCDVKADARLVELFKSWQDHICGEVRAKQITFTDEPAGERVDTLEINGTTIVVGVSSSKI